MSRLSASQPGGYQEPRDLPLAAGMPTPLMIITTIGDPVAM